MKKLFLLLVILPGISLAFDNKGQVLSSAGGRYVFGQISEFRNDQYLLDTQTGKMWVMQSNKDNKLVLAPIFFVSGPGRYTTEPPPKLEFPSMGNGENK